MDMKLAKDLVAGIHRLQVRNEIYGKGVKKIDIRPDDLIEIYNNQKGLCYWSGHPLESRYNKISWHPEAISTDRIDNSVGYRPDNVVLCQRIWNLGRACFPATEFKQVMESMKFKFRKDYEGAKTVEEFLL